MAGERICFKIDTGAEASILPQSAVESFTDRPQIHKSSTILKTIDGAHFAHMGKGKLALKANSKEVEEVYIINKNVTPLLGLQTALKLLLIQRSPNQSIQINTVQRGLTHSRIMEDYQDLFNGNIGRYPGFYRIHLTDNAIPKINPPRWIPHHLSTPLKNRLQEMVKQGIVEPVDKPTD